MVIVHQRGALLARNAVEQLFGFGILLGFNQQQGQLHAGIHRFGMLFKIFAHELDAKLGRTFFHEGFGIEQIERNIIGPDAQGLLHDHSCMGRLAAEQPHAAFKPDVDGHVRLGQQRRSGGKGVVVLIVHGLRENKKGVSVERIGRKLCFNRAQRYALEVVLLGLCSG